MDKSRSSQEVILPKQAREGEMRGLALFDRDICRALGASLREMQELSERMQRMIDSNPIYRKSASPSSGTITNPQLDRMEEGFSGICTSFLAHDLRELVVYDSSRIIAYARIITYDPSASQEVVAA